MVEEGKPREQLKAEARQAEAVMAAHPAAASRVVPRPVRHYRALVFQGYIVAAVIVFAVLFFFARTVPYFGFDLTIEHALQAFNPFWFDRLMVFVSQLGFNPQAWVWSGLFVVLVFVAGLRWEAISMTFAGLGVSLLGTLVKIVVQRERPTDALVHVFQPLTDYSFPSGHVLFYTAFLGMCFFLIYTLLKHSPARTLALILCGALIALVGPSRVYLGQHWPSDVLGAYMLGSVWLALSIFFYRWGKTRFFVHQPVAPEPEPRSTTVRPGPSV